MPTLDETLRGRARAGRGDPILLWRRHSGGAQLFALRPGVRRVTIGRGPANDISLSWDTEVSRVHAELERFGGEWTLVDEGHSRGGTRVNGERVTGRRRLRDGDVLLVGRTELTFHVPARRQPRAAVAARGPAAAPRLTAAQLRVLEALCRPYKETEFAAPATNEAIAEELFLSVDAVKAHLRALAAAFGVDALPPSRQRAYMATRAMQLGLVR
jgi:hypothetical protein